MWKQKVKNPVVPVTEEMVAGLLRIIVHDRSRCAMEEIEEMEDPVDTRFFHQVAAVYSDVIQRGEASIQNGKSPADTLRDMIMPLLERCQEISVAFKENHGNRAALNSLWNQSRPYRVVIETILRSALTIIPVDMAEQMILVTRNDYYPGTLPNI